MISITLTYLCQTAVCWAVMLLFYELFLRKSTHHHLSRLYLLSALILGATIPLLPDFFTQAPEFVYTFQGSIEDFAVVVNAYTAPQAEQLFDWTAILQSLYIIVVALMLFRIVFGIYKIMLIKPIRKTKNGAIEINYHQENIQPFSFLNKIFIPKDYPEKFQQIVLAHEMSHVKQGHSIDIIVSRAMAAIFWVNPMIRLFERYLKEVHEHFADQYTLANYDLKTYQGALRFSAFSSVGLRMAQAFNSNNIRKRLRKMKKSNSSIFSKFLYVAILPIAVILSMAMNTYDGVAIKSAFNNIKENTGKILNATTGINGDIMHLNLIDTVPPPPPPPPPAPSSSGVAPPPPPPEPPYPPIILGDQNSSKVEPKSLHDLINYKHSSSNNIADGISLKGTFGDPLVDLDGDLYHLNSDRKPNNLRPEEIESVKVLKGEQAIAAYGERAAAGVIIVKTKKGSKLQSAVGTHPAVVTSSVPSPPPPPPAFLQENLLYTVVDQKPRFPGCETIVGDVNEKEKCSNSKLIEYLANNINYPEKAKKFGVDGTVIIQFTVTLEGKIRDAIVARNIGYGCGQEALRVVKKMNEDVGMWTPGKKGGKAVHVQFNLPVRFKIDGIESESSKNVGKKTFTTVDAMPRFPGCESMPTNQMEACSKKKLLSFIYKNVNYPETAKRNNIQGMVVVGFIVNTDGSLSEIELVKDIGGGCGDEAVRVVNLMNEEGYRWVPGVHDDERVRVRYKLPIKYKLNNTNIDLQKPDSQGDEIFKIVEQKPRFPGCEDIIGTQIEKEKCAQEAMIQFLYSNIKYPEAARKNGTEGVVVIQFVVEKDGSISNPRIVREVKNGCSEESMRVLNLMSHMEEKWTPGKQRGRAVRVQYNLPVKFKLTDDAPSKENKIIGEF